jgi:formylglycine-generating enzyme required for sulfatase activity
MQAASRYSPQSAALHVGRDLSEAEWEYAARSATSVKRPHNDLYSMERNIDH